MKAQKTVKFKSYIGQNECVEEWLKNRPVKTQETYASHLRRFCEFAKITPEQFQKMDKKTARDTAWKYISTLNKKDSASVAITAMAALKSFYRNHDGDILPFDSTKHGKHYVKPHAKKAIYEHVPTKEEVYKIIDKSVSLRDSTMMLVLFQSGIRKNALLNLKYGMVREPLQKGTVPLHLKITSEIDSKLCGYDLPYYDTFLSNEAIESLRKYCEKYHKDSLDDMLLFRTRQGKKMYGESVWLAFKKATERAGFDSKTMWVHSLRKAFKSQVRKANVQEELAEALMGHRLKGSRESYMNRNDAIEELRLAYEQCDFTREGKTERQDREIQQLKRELEEERKSAKIMQQRFESMIEEANEKTLIELQNRLEQLQIQIGERQMPEPSRKNGNVCPQCGLEPYGEPIKTWMLGEKTKVSRHQCRCGKQFNVFTAQHQ
jgi:integrase